VGNQEFVDVASRALFYADRVRGRGRGRRPVDAFHHVSHVNLERQAHEAELLRIIEGYDPEFLVLAKYMRLLTRLVFEDRVFLCGYRSVIFD